MSAPTTSAGAGVRFTGAHAVLEALVRGGVRHLHGVPGHGAYPIYDALHDVEGIDPILARHEQGAGFAAVGEAWAGGGVAAATSVPRAGLANSATPLMEASASQDPVLFLVEAEAGQEGLAGAVAHRHVRLAPDAALGQVVDGLLSQLAFERPGAVVLEIPSAALTAPVPAEPACRRAAARAPRGRGRRAGPLLAGRCPASR